ncbi:MAG: GGDEF domain-containing protein [Methylotenera sp.]|nr:MAG: GGDEF domain-containing protein [Methylotenera sp.]
MNLDVRTIMVMFAMLSIMFAGLILLAGLNTSKINSVKQWAIASLCIGIGLGSSYFFYTHSDGARIAVVLGGLLIALSIALQFTGIQSFKSERISYRLAAIFVVFAVIQTYWFEFQFPNVNARSIANSLLFSLGYAGCASILLMHVKPEFRSISSFTGIAFAGLSAILLLRAILIYQSPSSLYSLYTNIPINPGTFITTCLMQVCVTFGFLLMLNQHLMQEVKKIASRDMLTGAYNRRQFEEEIARLQSRSERNQDHFSLMLIDIDDFKFINDNYGHPSGDEVLRRLSQIALKTIRAQDYWARFGGDEFCILLPSTNADDALILANRLRETFANVTFMFGGKPNKSSISIGIADTWQVGLNYHSLLAAADQALYQAKLNGRNQVVFHSLEWEPQEQAAV